MSGFVLSKQHLREVLIFFFNGKKSAVESHRMLVEVYGESALSDKTCREWFRRFKSGDFSVEDKERSGQPQKFEDDELEALLDPDPCQTQTELAESLGVTQKTISVLLKQSELIQKQGNWVPYELKPRDVERRFFTSELLLERHQKRDFCTGSCLEMKSGYTKIRKSPSQAKAKIPNKEKYYAKPGEPVPSMVMNHSINGVL